MFVDQKLIGVLPIRCVLVFKGQMDRDDLSDIDILYYFAQKVNPHGAAFLLEKARSKWNTKPKEKGNKTTWYDIIDKLISVLCTDDISVAEFCNSHPDLLYTDHALNDLERNWLKKHKQYTPVNSPFQKMNYESLTAQCNRDGIYPIKRWPSDIEKQKINILIQTMHDLLIDFFPKRTWSIPVGVISNDSAMCEGIATVEKIKNTNVKDENGFVFKNNLSCVFIKSMYLTKDSYANALSVLIEEFCHIFGNDKDPDLVDAVAHALAKVAANTEVVENYTEKWLRVD